MQCEHCYTAGPDLDPEFFRDCVETVMEKMTYGTDTPVSVVAVTDPADCQQLLDRVAVEDETKFLENCQSAQTSISYRANDQEFILLKADKEFITSNKSALRGLIAHELMHTVQRRKGIEKEIEEAARSYQDDAIQQLQELGLDNAQVTRFIRTVFQTAIFSLKDIYANTDLIRESFAADLEEYYYHMLGIEQYCPAPEFYGEEAEPAEVQDALSFELGLLPAWLPFEALNHSEADKIRHRIEECYEKDIPQVAYYVHTIRDLYHDKYDNPGEFKNLFFQQIVDSAAQALSKKLGLTE